MSQALSLDLRIRVLEAVAEGLGQRAAAARRGVSAASVSRWRRRVRVEDDTLPDTFDLKGRMACQNLEIAVTVKHGEAGADCYRCDETIDQLANGLSPSPTQSMDGSSLVVVHRPSRNRCGPREQAPKIMQVPLVPGSGQNLHSNGVADRNPVVQQHLDTITDW